MKILFFPNDLGGGFGHISRCIALAETLCQRGHDVAFALSGLHSEKVAAAGYKTFSLTSPQQSARPDTNGPAFLYIPTMAYQVVRDGFDNPKKVELSISEALKIINIIKPDLLIGDGYLLTWLLGKQTGIPVVQIVKSIAHPKPEQMVWWENKPDDLIEPDPLPVFNPVINRLSLPEITCAEQLLSGDLLLLPSICVLDSMDSLPDQTYYVGGLIRKPVSSNTLPDWFSELNDSHPIIYVTVGGAAGHGGGHGFFKMIVETFEKIDCHVVVSTGGKVDSRSIGRMPKNIRLVNWVPGPEMIKRSDLVVFHGGYTRMEILMNGLPSIIIPFHSEQEYYGRIMEKAGIAKVVHYSKEPYKCKKHYWKGGNRWRKTKPFTLHIRSNMTLRPETLRDAVEDILSNKKIRLRTAAIRKDIENAGGCDKAINLIKNQLNV